jgi:hypothetical protein
MGISVCVFHPMVSTIAPQAVTKVPHRWPPKGLLAIFATALAVLLTATPSIAVPIFTTGAGSAVTLAGRSATFDAITFNGLDLSSYSEDLLSISVPDPSFVGFDPFNGGPFTAFHYGTAGNSNFVTIRGTDNAVFSAMEFLLGTGFQEDTVARIRWATFLNNVQTGTGQSVLVEGTIVGWSDPSGFDELRVIADNGTVGTLNFGDFQAIALDDVQAQLVPEPSTAALLLASGLAALAVMRRRRAL